MGFSQSRPEIVHFLTSHGRMPLHDVASQLFAFNRGAGSTQALVKAVVAIAKDPNPDPHVVPRVVCVNGEHARQLKRQLMDAGMVEREHFTIIDASRHRLSERVCDGWPPSPILYDNYTVAYIVDSGIKSERQISDNIERATRAFRQRDIESRADMRAAMERLEAATARVAELEKLLIGRTGLEPGIVRVVAEEGS